jgi:hypothetical protein
MLSVYFCGNEVRYIFSSHEASLSVYKIIYKSMIGWWGAPLSQCLTTAEEGHILDETGCKNLFSF